MKLREETKFQIAVFEYINTLPSIRDVSFHCPNEGRRGLIEGRILKRMGLRAGVPDIFIACPRGDYHGLFIELKIKPNRPSVTQKAFMEKLRKKYYMTAVCYSFEEVTACLEAYLKYPLPPQMVA